MMSDGTGQRREEGAQVSTSRRAPRQARAAETRRRLLDAGFQAFATKGVDGANLVEDVLEPAGVSIGSFYHQFADKAELLREILAEAADRRRAFIVRLSELDPAGDLDSTVRLVVERLHDSLEQDAAAWQLQRISRVTGADSVHGLGPAGRESWTDALGQLLGAWFARPPAELRQAGGLVVTLARGFVSDFLDTPAAQRPPRAQQVDAFTRFVVGGLTALLGAPQTQSRR
jgi:AcrR family transcriptional regulator